jgi:hypothetical protein
LRAGVEDEDILHWIGSQFGDLLSLSTKGAL